MSIRGGQLRVLDTDQLYDIHLATLEILDRIGVKIFDEEAVRVLREAGCCVDARTKTVRIPEYLVKEAIKKAPSGFSLYGRDTKYSLRFEDRRVHFSLQGTGLKVLDLDTGQCRESTLRDTELFFKLGDALENIDHAAVTVWPRDVPDVAAHAYATLAGFKNTIKTIDGYSFGKDSAMDTIKMASVIAGGEEELRKKPRLVGFHNPVSPLQHSEQLTQGLLVYSKYGQAMIIAPECQAGSTAPVTLSGLLAQQNAEVLSGIVMYELVNPGAPVFYGTVSTIADMRTGGIALGSAETGLINVATAQLAQYYGVPSRGTGGTTDSKIPDIQAGFEKGITLLMAALSGINFIYDAGGSLESTLTASCEQLVIDNDICGTVSRVLRGVDVNDETLAIDVIEKVGPGGHFLGQRHTLDHFRREQYLPRMINRMNRDGWEKAGSRDMRDVARVEAKRILKEHEPEPLDPDVERELRGIIKKIERRKSKGSSVAL